MLETTHTMTADLGDTTVPNLMAELSTSAGQADPYPIYARLRRLGPALAAPGDALIVTGYRECSALLREPRLRKNPGRLLEASGFPDWRDRPALSLMFESLLMTNPPDHTRVRGLVAREFTARRVAAMRPAVEAIADRLLDGLRDEADFVQAVAETVAASGVDGSSGAARRTDCPPKPARRPSRPRSRPTRRASYSAGVTPATGCCSVPPPPRCMPPC